MFAGKYNRMLELLWFIGYCREFPSQLADRICGHPDWNRHVKYAALKKGYISVYRVQYRQRVIRSLRLTPLGLEYIAQRDPKVLPYVMAQQDSGAGTRNVTERILRYHAQATALIMARNAGAVFLPDQKPSLLANPLASSAAYDPKQNHTGVSRSNPRARKQVRSHYEDCSEVVPSPRSHRSRTMLLLPLPYRTYENVLARRHRRKHDRCG